MQEAIGSVASIKASAVKHGCDECFQAVEWFGTPAIYLTLKRDFPVKSFYRVDRKLQICHTFNDLRTIPSQKSPAHRSRRSDRDVHIRNTTHRRKTAIL